MSWSDDSRVYAALRDGLDLGRFDDLPNWPVSQLGFALKVLAFEQRRLDRLGRRLDRGRGRSRPKGDADRNRSENHL